MDQGRRRICSGIQHHIEEFFFPDTKVPRTSPKGQRVRVCVLAHRTQLLAPNAKFTIIRARSRYARGQQSR